MTSSTSTEKTGTQRHGLQLALSDRRLLLRLGDAFFVIVSTLLALYVWSIPAPETFSLEFVGLNAYWFPILIALWLALASANDFYELSAVEGRMEVVRRLLSILLQVLFFYLLIFFVSPRNALPRLFILYYAIISFSLISIWHLLGYNLYQITADPRRVVIVGQRANADIVLDLLKSATVGIYEVVGTYWRDADPRATGAAIRGGKLAQFSTEQDVREILLTSIQDLTPEMFREVMTCYERGVSVTLITQFYERVAVRVPVDHIMDDWANILSANQRSALNPYPRVKRLMDITLAVVGLVVFAPIFPLLALLIRLDSPGGVIYSQTRSGQSGAPFTIYKLRTMVSDAEAETGAVFAQKNDARITRIGSFLRRSRLDEFPQLINVLRGEMSIIGPRPERPEHVERLSEKIPFYRARLIAKPGLSGWAQVRYQYGATDEDARVKLEYDLYYIRHANLLLDINIILRTVGKVVRLTGT